MHGCVTEVSTFITCRINLIPACGNAHGIHYAPRVLCVIPRELPLLWDTSLAVLLPPTPLLLTGRLGDTNEQDFPLAMTS